MKTYIDILKEKEKHSRYLTLEKYIYTRGIFPNLFISFFIWMNLILVLPLSKIEFITFTLIFFATILLSIFALNPIINKFISVRLSNEMGYYLTSGLDLSGRTALLKKVMLLPRFKMVETLMYYILLTVILATSSSSIFELSKANFLYLILTCVIYSYLAAIISYDSNDKTATSLALHISKQGIDEKDISKKVFYGIPLKYLFVLYIIIPIVLMSLIVMDCFFLSANEDKVNNAIFYYTGITNVIFIIALTLMYFKKFRDYNILIQNALKTVNIHTVSSTESVFPVDYANNISYTMHLTNRAIKLFQDMINNYTTVSREMNEAYLDLSDISVATKATIAEQSASVTEINTTIQNNTELANKIDSKIQEVIRIAEKNLEAVKANYLELDNNLYRLQEITEENEKTISGIQTLSSKINSVQDIINLINSVASQTKIIAFNAQIESSKINSSENLVFVSHGIRDLAEETIELTKEIKEKIALIKQASTSLIEHGEVSMQKINEENQIAQGLKNKFNSIRFSATSTSTDARKIQESILIQNNSMKAISQDLETIIDSTKNFVSLSTSINNVILNLYENSNLLDLFKSQEEENIFESKSEVTE